MDKFVSHWDLGPPSEAPDLTAIAHAATVEAMVEWFFTNFEDPAQNMPRDDGEWVWVWGGPYYARDELENAFPTADEHALDAAVYRIEADGWEWAPASSPIQPEETDVA